jgi:uncharacterized protein
MSGITVTGHGETAAAPDVVSVDLGVSVLGDTVAEARSKAADAATALMDALNAAEVAPGSISTVDYSVFPEYDYRAEKERLIGYRVNNTVQARISDLSRSGEIIDDAINAAGDYARINSVTFSIEDDSSLEQAAREAAWNDAIEKANQLAQLSGRTLGSVESIAETVNQPPGPGPVMRMAVADSATPIHPGTTTVAVTLTVEFSFGG